MEVDVRKLIPMVAAGVAALMLTAARPAFAQEVKGDFGISYAVLHDSDWFPFTSARTFPAGFFLALAADMSKPIRIVAEFGGGFKTVHEPTGTFRTQVTTYLGGVRYVTAGPSNSHVLVQFLAGGARASIHLIDIGGTTQADNGFALQPGVGVEFPLTKKVFGRAQVDYRAVRTEGEVTKEYRIGFGAVIPFGR